MVTSGPVLRRRGPGTLGLLGVAVGLLLLPARPRAVEELDLLGAIRRAFLFNRDLKRSVLSAETATLGVAAAESDFDLSIRPEGSAGAGQGLGTNKYGLTVSKRLPWGSLVSASGSESSSPELGLYADDAYVQVEQPVLRNFGVFMQRAPVAQAENASLSAHRQADGQRADTLLRVVEAYEAIVRGHREVTSAAESLKRMGALLELTKAKELVGRATRVDSLRVELLRGQSTSQLESAQKRLSSAQREFASLLSAPPGKVFELRPMVGVATPPRDEGLKVAMSHRADLAQAEQDVGDAERNAEVAWRGMLPDLNAVARYERFEAAPMVSQSRRFDETIWFLGLSGSVDLTFEKRRVAAEQARIAKDSALQALSSAKLTVEKEVNEAYEAKERAESEAAIREENARVARARVNLAHVLFELGRVDAFGVTDAEQADVTAEEDLLVSRGEADLAGYRLRRALGTLLLVPDELQAKERGP